MALQTHRSPKSDLRAGEYSAKKPVKCDEPVTFCLDCGKNRCNFNEGAAALARWKAKRAGR